MLASVGIRKCCVTCCMFACAQAVVSLCLLTCVAVLVARTLRRPVMLDMFYHERNQDVFVLGLVRGRGIESPAADCGSHLVGCVVQVSLCLSMSLVTGRMGLSLEMGAFMAGLTVRQATHLRGALCLAGAAGWYHSSVGCVCCWLLTQVTWMPDIQRSLASVAPLSRVFGGMFFASVGMLVSPVRACVGAAPALLLLRGCASRRDCVPQAYVWFHAAGLLQALVVVFVVKVATMILIMRMFGFTGSAAITSAVALAQVTEYSLMFTGACVRAGAASV